MEIAYNNVWIMSLRLCNSFSSSFNNVNVRSLITQWHCHRPTGVLGSANIRQFNSSTHIPNDGDTVSMTSTAAAVLWMWLYFSPRCSDRVYVDSNPQQYDLCCIPKLFNYINIWTLSKYPTENKCLKFCFLSKYFLPKTGKLQNILVTIWSWFGKPQQCR